MADIKKAGRGPFQLRPYQSQALDSFLDLYQQGVNRQLLAAAVGTGKTVVGAHIPCWFPKLAEKGMLWVVHREELAYQAAETFETCWPERSVQIEKGKHEASPDADFVVATRQTLAASRGERLQKWDRENDLGIICVDECHHATRGSQYAKIANYFGVGPKTRGPMSNGEQRLSVGFTATPNRHDGEGLHHFYSEIAENYDLRWAVEQGWLVDITAKRIETETDISGVSTSMGDFAKGELGEAINTHQRNEVIVKGFQEHGGQKALAYTVTVDQAHALAEAFRDNGHKAVAVDGKTDEDVRKRRVYRFKKRDLEVLVNVGCFTEGFDAPQADTILMARPTKSEMLYNQILGRATRPVVDLNGLSHAERLEKIRQSKKPHMRILDFADLVGKHEIVTAPSLFGLNDAFEVDGESVTQAVEIVEEAERENPGQDFRAAKDLEEVELMVEDWSVWDTATSTDEVPFECDLMWMEIDDGRFQLQIPIEEDITWGTRVFQDVNRTEYFSLQQNRLGEWEMTLRRMPVWREDMPIVQPAEWSDTEEGLQAAVDRAEAYVKDEYDDSLPLIKRDMQWHEDPASEGQVGYLKSLGVTVPDAHELTKGRASKLIAAAKAQQNAT